MRFNKPSNFYDTNRHEDEWYYLKQRPSNCKWSCNDNTYLFICSIKIGEVKYIVIDTPSQGYKQVYDHNNPEENIWFLLYLIWYFAPLRYIRKRKCTFEVVVAEIPYFQVENH